MNFDFWEDELTLYESESPDKDFIICLATAQGGYIFELSPSWEVEKEIIEGREFYKIKKKLVSSTRDSR